MTARYAVKIDNLTFTRPAFVNACDLDGDGDCDDGDADDLVAAIVAGSTEPLFDLTGDGLVNQQDLDQWLVSAGEWNLGPGRAYLRADGNLDGVVDASDFILWNAHKFSSGGLWTGGDWNADGFTDGGDFVLWNAHKFQSSDAATRVAPTLNGLEESKSHSLRHHSDPRRAARTNRRSGLWPTDAARYRV